MLVRLKISARNWPWYLFQLDALEEREVGVGHSGTPQVDGAADISKRELRGLREGGRVDVVVQTLLNGAGG